ncbi:hypothetical protein Acy02nite_56670 [Actinoplanes cyaneus]|uniref:Uncharacterized protein n=1 Tax=Actinoplanes cyaneus TaxID=52696 RepID=A0A919IMJ1_9ACTN|nr:hypothetical protein [Actinoplanes cyaneus]MCW2139920.1 hypothetical protein [Actinoplanes cyaneus]GID67786.1 hypothetical protein Acy02nite_56670 [Actinoplanes cyaneus]
MTEVVTHVDAAPAQVSAALQAVPLPLVLANVRHEALVEHTGDGRTRMTQRIAGGRDFLVPYLQLQAGRIMEHAEATARVDRAGLALVLHAVAAEAGGTGREWHRIAGPALAAGGDWPALAELAADGPLATSDDYLDADIHAAQKRLADQLAAELGDRPRLDYWDMIAGVAARACTLGVIGPYDLAGVLGSYGHDTMDEDSAGADMMWEVWSTNAVEGSTAEFGGYGGPGYDEEELRVRGDRLIPPGSINGPLALVLTEFLHG